MHQLHITIQENGYGIFDSKNKTFLVEGIRSWCTACELHEMLTGEMMGD